MKKLKKNVIRAPYFWEKRHSFVKISAWELHVYQRNGIFLDKIWTREQGFFRDKSWKKGILLTFLAHTTYTVVWTEVTFFGPIMGMTTGAFHEKLKNMIWEHKSKVDRTVFIDKKQNILIMGLNEEKLVRHPYVRKTWSTFYDFF